MSSFTTHPWLIYIATLVALSLYPQTAQALTRHYEFNITMQKVTRLCHTKNIVTVNGEFPGPRIVAREGDRLLIKVNNHVTNNISIHWHGIRQLQSGWADGPAYITQCPIQTGQSYVYNYTIVNQRGTLFWYGGIAELKEEFAKSKNLPDAFVINSGHSRTSNSDCNSGHSRTSNSDCSELMRNESIQFEDPHVPYII